MITIDEMQEMLEEIASDVPEDFFQELNGGILLLPDSMISSEARREDLYTMGEYITDPIMGRYIALYYGSFRELFQGEPTTVLRKELKETLLHEFTHHMESLAGEYGLEIKDREELQDYLREEQGGYISSPKPKAWRTGRLKQCDAMLHLHCSCIGGNAKFPQRSTLGRA